MEQLDKYIKNYFNDQDIFIKCLSRLFHKNVVYYVQDKNKEYIFKFFIMGENKKERYITEKEFYQFFNNHQIISLPRLINFEESPYGNLLITEYIKGISLKKKLKNEGLFNNLTYIKYFLKDLERIWQIDYHKLNINLPIDEIGLDKRLNLDENGVFSKIQNLKPNVDFSQLFSVYYELKNNISFKDLYLINSDVSAHEYIINDKGCYWIDFERFRLGNPNNDLARAFISISNSIYQNALEVDYLYEMVKENPYFNKEIFLYYLLEKLLGNIYIDYQYLEDEEIKFFCNFALNLYNDKEKLKKTKLL